jgi:hypothetical protein
LLDAIQGCLVFRALPAQAASPASRKVDGSDSSEIIDGRMSMFVAAAVGSALFDGAPLSDGLKNAAAGVARRRG